MTQHTNESKPAGAGSATGPFSHIPTGPQKAPHGNERTCKTWAAEAAMRMLMNNLDAEVAEALSGQSSLVIRPRPLPSRFQPLSSESRRAKIRLFVAIPVEIEGEILGSIVVSRTPREEVQALYQMAPTAALSALGALLFTLALAWGAGVLAARSLRGLDQGAQRIADGDFGGIDDLARPRHSHIAEVAGVARSFTRMASRLQERMGYIGEFASNVSHEFKTPLATLRGTVELLSDDEEMPGVQRERFLDNAERELDRLERMVTGLLSLARADESHSRSPVVLDEVLASVARDAGIELQGRAHPVLGDRDQLEAVASNLVQNALRHGGDGVCVQIRACSDTSTPLSRRGGAWADGVWQWH